MNIIDRLKDRAKKDKKTIVLPETMDIRIIEATEKLLKEDICNIVLIGKVDEINNISKGYDISKAIIIDPFTDSNTEYLINKLVKLRKHKGMTYEEAKHYMLSDYMYYACMLVKTGKADGIVSGACHSTPNTLRPSLQIIKTKPGTLLVSACFLMDIPNCEYGEDGVFVFADCGLEQNPDSEKLAAIAASSAETFKLLVEKEPIVAMLSHSSMGCACHPDVSKVQKAVQIAKDKYREYLIDGEMQLDAAIIPEVAKYKTPYSKVAGNANVLVFPDLDAGNIGYKLVQRFAHANAYGPICQGIADPVNDLSRACSVEDIIGVVAITCCQAQNNEII